MNRNLTFGLVGLISLALLGLFTWAFYNGSDPKEIPSALINSPATDFTLKTIQGETITLSNFKGRPVVLNFWASWCVACRMEAQLIEAANQKYTPQGAVFIGVAINDELDDAMGFIHKYGKTYLLGLDDKVGTISLDYGVTAVPETFFIDKEGIIRHKVLGAVTGYDIENFMKENL